MQEGETCGFGPRVQEWFEEAFQTKDPEVTEHLKRCRACHERVLVWQKNGLELKQLVDEGVGEVQPLLALQNIRQRIAASSQRGLAWRLQRWWRDLWTFNRRAVIGVLVAAGLGVLCAPMIYALGAGAFSDEAAYAAVEIESLEFDGNARAMVYNPDGGTTTIIWWEAEGDSAYGDAR